MLNYTQYKYILNTWNIDKSLIKPYRGFYFLASVVLEQPYYYPSFDIYGDVIYLYLFAGFAGLSSVAILAYSNLKDDPTVINVWIISAANLAELNNLNPFEGKIVYKTYLTKWDVIRLVYQHHYLSTALALIFCGGNFAFYVIESNSVSLDSIDKIIDLINKALSRKYRFDRIDMEAGNSKKFHTIYRKHLS